MRVLVTGAASELGYRVTSALEADSSIDTVAAIDLRPPPRRFRRAQMTVLDPRERRKLVTAVQRFAPTAIAHLGVYEPDARSQPALAAERTQTATMAVLGAAADLGGLDRIVVRSGLEVYGRGPGMVTVPDEDVAPDPRTPFGRSLVDVERVAVATGHSAGVPVTSLRLAPVQSPGGPSPLARLLRLPAVPVDALADPTFSVLHVDDAAAAVVAALAVRHHGPLNVVGPGAVSVLQAVASAAASPSRCSHRRGRWRGPWPAPPARRCPTTTSSCCAAAAPPTAPAPEPSSGSTPGGPSRSSRASTPGGRHRRCASWPVRHERKGQLTSAHFCTPWGPEAGTRDQSGRSPPPGALQRRSVGAGSRGGGPRPHGVDARPPGGGRRPEHDPVGGALRRRGQPPVRHRRAAGRPAPRPPGHRPARPLPRHLAGPLDTLWRRAGGATDRPEELAGLLRAGEVVLVPLSPERRSRRRAGAVAPERLAPALALDAPVIPLALVGNELTGRWTAFVGDAVPRPPGSSPLSQFDLAASAQAAVQALLDDAFPPRWIWG